MRIIKITRSGQSESQIQQSICLYLKMKHYFFWRQNNVGIYDAKRGAYRTNPNTLRGIPDIFVMDGARFIALEVKIETGRLSPDQKEFGLQFHLPPVREYHVVRSVADVQLLGL